MKIWATATATATARMAIGMDSTEWSTAFSIATDGDIVGAFSLVAFAWCGASIHTIYRSKRGSSESAGYGAPFLGAAVLLLVAWFLPRQIFLSAVCCTLALWLTHAMRMTRPASAGAWLLAVLFGLAWCVPIWIGSVFVLMPR